MVGPDIPWVDGLTVPHVLARRDRSPDADAVVFPQCGYRRTYRQFQAEVREYARALMALGVQRGDMVGIWATNWPQWIVTQFAVAQIGAVLVNVNPAYRSHELTYVLQQADIHTLILTDRFKSSDYFAILAEACPEIDGAGPLCCAAFPKLKHVISIKSAKRGAMRNWEELRRLAGNVSEAELDQREAQIGPHDVVNVQYTSGTTGFPKGAMLTHRNLLMNAYYVGGHELRRRRTAVHPVPLYHCFGCVMGTLGCACMGRDGGGGRGLRSARHAGGGSGRALAPPSTACPPCSSRNSIIRASPSSI